MSRVFLVCVFLGGGWGCACWYFWRLVLFLLSVVFGAVLYEIRLCEVSGYA